MEYQKTLKIGVFYDGNFVNHVSEYYAFRHPVKSRLSLKGLEEYVINQIATRKNIETHHCKVVESHLYKGRSTARAADERDVLYGERVFDDACMYDGITTHYLPTKIQNGRVQNKGIDVWLALDAYELASMKNLDVVVLVTTDTDFKPLIKKLHSLGTKVLLLGWNFEWEGEAGPYISRTSRELTDLSNWFIDVASEIEADIEKMKKIFVPRVEREFKDNGDDFYPQYSSKPRISRYSNPDDFQADDVPFDPENRIESEILNIKSGFGFISYPPNNIFFHASDVMVGAFSKLEEGDAVEFQIHTKPNGEIVAKHIKLLLANDSMNHSYDID
jgi:uncharacterized LabA/DUF88 family protein/cold shock CspA family protein